MLLALLFIILLVLAFAGLFYRPLGTGYIGYAPSGLFILVAIIVLLYLLGVL
jgi:hypothetical protein